MVGVQELLRSKIDQAFASQWDPRRPTKAEVVKDGDRLGLRLWAMDHQGNWHIVWDEAPTMLATRIEVEELLARSLSNFLMEHPRWTRR